MGLQCKTNAEGLYQVTDSIGGELVHHGEWVTEDGVKKGLIEEAFFDFITK